MPTQAVNAQGIINRGRPTRGTESTERAFRTTMYGEELNQQVHQKAHLLADEGSYFTATNPTPNTGVAGNNSSAAVPAIGSGDTKPYIVVQNTGSPSDPLALRVYFDYLRLRTTAIGTAGASVNFCTILDAANVARNPQGGSSITPVNPNMDSGLKSVCTVQAGAVSVSSTSTGRLMPNLQFRSTIGVVGDLFVVSFGPTEYNVASLVTTSSSTQTQCSFGHPPIIIGPGQFALFYVWQPSQTAASSYEFDLSWWER